MAFDYDSETWAVHTTIEHALDMLTSVNSTLSSKGYGTEDLLKASSTNAIWIMLLAQGGLRANYDFLLYKAQSSLDPALCSDDQFLNLLPIVGTELVLGDYSTVEITITASSLGNVTIPANSEMPFTNDVYFRSPNEEIVILAEDTDSFTVTANIRGDITVLANQLLTFSETIANISVITSAQSINGTEDETITECRERVIKGKTFDNNVDGLVNDLLNLQGISYAKAYFNPDSISDLELPGGITISPRTLQVYVVGSSTKIAETVFKKLMLKTQGSETQTYTTLSGQAFEILYDYADSVSAYVTVYIPFGAVLSSSIQLAIKTLVSSLNFDIGESVKSSKIDQLFIDFTAAEIVGSEVSLDDMTYGLEQIIDANNYATVPIANITIENMPEV